MNGIWNQRHRYKRRHSQTDRSQQRPDERYRKLRDRRNTTKTNGDPHRSNNPTPARDVERILSQQEYEQTHPWQQRRNERTTTTTKRERCARVEQPRYNSQPTPPASLRDDAKRPSIDIQPVSVVPVDLLGLFYRLRTDLTDLGVGTFEITPMPLDFQLIQSRHFRENSFGSECEDMKLSCPGIHSQNTLSSFLLRVHV